MTAVGRKIRQLRTQLCLSQADLAGSEMTRAFISQLETGRAQPSLRNLTIISARLGRPVTYFLDNEDCMTMGLENLEQSVHARGRGDYIQAVKLARSAIASLMACGDADLLLRARIALVDGLLARRDYEQAWPPLYEAFESAVLTGQSAAIGTVMFWWGRCALQSEEFRSAKRYFHQARDRLTVRKSDRGICLRALLYYGSCCLRLGDLEEAKDTYSNVYGQTASPEYVHIHIEAGAGLGWVHHLNGDDRGGREILLTVRGVSERHGGYRLVSVDHNLSIVSSHLGENAAPLRTMQNCVTQYQAQGEFLSAAAVLEEMSAHHLRWNRMEDTRHAAENGLDLIVDHSYANLQRGRLHRMLGQIALVDEDQHEGLHQVEMAIAYFQAVHAYGELETTFTLHHRLRSLRKRDG